MFMLQNSQFVFPVCGKYEYLYVIAELYFHTFEEGLEVEAPKANPAAVTLVSCPVEREDIPGNKCYITSAAAVHC